MSFSTSPPPDDEPSREASPTSYSPWNTPPADDARAGFAAPPASQPFAEIGQFSHGGLAGVDPWTERTPWHQAIWPWGLGGIAETLDVVILALVMFLCVRFVAHNYIVDGASMVPTFEDSDFLIVNRLAYRSFDFSWVPGVDDDNWRPFGSPQPGDVVVFAYQQSPTERDFIKRVIAVEGQSVEITDGTVYVDDVPLVEPYIAQAPTAEFPRTVVGPGMLFVLGDNRNNSFDSDDYGPIEADTVVGRADLRYWPLSRLGMVEHVLGEPGNDSVADGLERAGGGLAAAWW